MEFFIVLGMIATFAVVVLTGMAWDNVGFYLRSVKEKNLLKRYLINAGKLAKVKFGEPDPWGYYSCTNVDKKKLRSFKWLSWMWALLPLTMIGLTILLLTFLMSSWVGWIILASTIGLIVGLKVLGLLLKYFLVFLGYLSDADSKVAKVFNGVKKLAEEGEES